MKKKPFRFKFDKKQSPFGLAKGKSWVLLANFLSDAQLNNAIAMRTAQLVGASHANHMIPVELYINGSYRGLYNLTEQVDLASNSVVVPDESKAALLEWDTYDGDPKRDSTYKLPVDLKAPRNRRLCDRLRQRGGHPLSGNAQQRDPKAHACRAC